MICEPKLCYLCSQNFGWANFQLSNIYTLDVLLCSDNSFQPSLNTIVTFGASVVGSFILRSILDILSKIALRKLTGNPKQKSLKQFEPGAYEFQVVKTGFLGFSQAVGFVLCISIYESCPCGGWLAIALWALSLSLLLSIPMGFISFSSAWYSHTLKEKKIEFKNKSPLSIWPEYFKSIINAGSASVKDDSNPALFHNVMKIIFAMIGSVCSVYGIASISPTDVFPAALLLGIGFVFIMFSRMLSTSKYGRSVVVGVTNCFSSLTGKRYFLQKKIVKLNLLSAKSFALWIIQSEDCDIAADKGFLNSGKHVLLTALLMAKAKFEAVCNMEILEKLRSRGKWRKTDAFEVLYGECVSAGFVFSVLLLFKSLMVGLLITSEPPLVSSFVKVSKVLDFQMLLAFHAMALLSLCRYGLLPDFIHWSFWDGSFSNQILM